MAVDPADRDDIRVVPETRVEALFSVLNDLGFRLVQVECEEADNYMGLPFVQEFEFRPVDGPFKNQVDELEIVFFPGEENVEVCMEIDRKARGLGSFLEMMGIDESRIKFSCSADDIGGLKGGLKEMIEENI